MPILLKHLMLRSLVLRVLRSLVLGPRSLPPRTLSTAQEGRELPLPSIPVGGGLSQFSTPIPFSVSSDPHKHLRLSEEVSVLLQKAAIEQVPTSSLGPGFYSRLFLVPQKKGGMRPVIDLSILNTYLVVPHFKMVTNRSIRASILPGMWSTSLDLTDAYFHCPISVAFRKYLRFVWDNKVFQFRALPFGLAIAPFSCCLSSPAHTIYPDSFLPGRFSCQGTQPRHSFVSYPDSYRPPPRTRFPDLLEEIGDHSISGFRFPRRTFQDGVGSCVSSRGEILALRQFILTFLTKTSVTARQFSQLLSLLNSLADVVQLGRLHICPLQFYLLEHWTPSSQDWEASIPILEVLSTHLSWWLQRENVMTGFPLASPVPSLTLFTDASLLGWGAYLEGQAVSGMWSSTLQKDHINLLEMRAVLLALSHFKLCLESISIVLATDNTTVVTYLKNQGGTHCYALYQLAKDVLILCSQFQIRLVVRHIPGRLNLLADSLSRSLAPVNTEWEFHQAVFQSIVLHWGNPNIDLFATSLNFKVTTFVSPVPDPRAYAVDAMSLSWEGMFDYVFPPFRFLAPVLHKITGEKCRIIVIAPAWP